MSALSLPPAGPNACQNHIKAFVPRAATRSGCLARTWHCQEGRDRQRGMLSLSSEAQTSLSISCPPSHPGVLFKGVSVSSGMCWRGMHRKQAGRWMGSATQARANSLRKAHGLPGDGQRAGQGAGTACVLGHGTGATTSCPRHPRATQGLMYPQSV